MTTKAVVDIGEWKAAHLKQMLALSLKRAALAKGVDLDGQQAG